VVTKERIVEEIRRVAKDRGGHVSLRSFHSASGIAPHQVVGRYWATWNEALAEAGVSTASFFRPKVDENGVIEAFAHFVERIKKWPTQNELKLEHRRNKLFPTLDVLRRVSSDASLASKITAFCERNPTLSTAASIALARMDTEKATPKALGQALVSGYGRCRSCENEHAQNRGRTLGGKFIQGATQAKTNGHKWTLSIQQYAAIVALDECFYCGGPLPKAACGLDRESNGD